MRREVIEGGDHSTEGSFTGPPIGYHGQPEPAECLLVAADRNHRIAPRTAQRVGDARNHRRAFE